MNSSSSFAQGWREAADLSILMLFGCNFGNMTTIAIFQIRGTSPDFIDELNRSQIGSESANIKSRRIQFVKLSCETDFRILMGESLWKTTYDMIWMYYVLLYLS